MAPPQSKPLASGVPPPHAGFFLGALLATAITLFPGDLEKYATVETFSRRVFPDLMSLTMLAYVRLSIAVCCWMTTVYMLTCANPCEIHANYRPKSKLKNATFLLSGFRHLCPFTSWSWCLLSTSFATSAYITLMIDMGKANEIDPMVLKAGLVLWEAAAPLALLVSTVVRYAIWPNVLASKRPHQLADFLYQMQHNTNSVFALTELCLLGGLPVKITHISLPAMFGSAYIMFSWSTSLMYTDPKEGPQYLYWFMDTTLGKGTTIALVALVSVLVMAFVTFSAIGSFVEWTGESMLAHVLCVVLVSSAVVKSS